MALCQSSNSKYSLLALTEYCTTSMTVINQGDSHVLLHPTAPWVQEARQHIYEHCAGQYNLL